MRGSEYIFVFICIGEICVILTGFANILVATGLQVLILLVLFRKLILDGYHPVAFATSFIAATVVFTGLSLLFRHTFVPLIFLAIAAALAIAVLIFAENRIEHKYRGLA
jgi:hypothetical protein